HRLAQIIESVAVGAGGVIIVELGDSQNQNRRLPRPLAINIDQGTQQAIVPLRVFTRRYDESPGLGVITRRRPAGGFEKLRESRRLDRARRKSSRAPTTSQKLVDAGAGFLVMGC